MHVFICALNTTWVLLCVICSACMGRPSKQIICEIVQSILFSLWNHIDLSSFIHIHAVYQTPNLQVCCSGLEQHEGKWQNVL